MLRLVASICLVLFMRYVARVQAVHHVHLDHRLYVTILHKLPIRSILPALLQAYLRIAALALRPHLIGRLMLI